MSDDEYNSKLASLQQYIPFLDNMILQLKDPTKKNREQQLTKMQSLHAMITDKRKKLKLETLTRCEVVISKLYEKVHNRPIGAPKKKSDSPSFTPASPSPTREFVAVNPLTIPTERLDGEIQIPKIDVYSSAAESLSNPRPSFSGLTLGARVPDMSKPPISLEDLKTLEDDVHDKINKSRLKSASLIELNDLRDMIAEQIHIEDIKSNSPQKPKKEEVINTTVRNNLNLTKKTIQPPEKPKSKEKTTESPKTSSPNKTKDDKSTSETNLEATSPKKEQKICPIQLILKPKSPKILKEPPSIFGNILSNIDGQILEGKKKKEERRSSLPGKEERRLSDSSKDKSSKSSDNKISETKKREERRSSDDNKTSETKKKEERRSSSSTKDEKKSEENTESKKKSERSNSTSPDKSKSSSKDSKHKDKSFSLSGKKTFEEEEQHLKEKLDQSDDTNVNSKEENSAEKNKDLVEEKDEPQAEKEKQKDATKEVVVTSKIFVKKDLELKPAKSDIAVENKEEVNKAPFVYKRLADKYNPKPRKPIIDADVDKAVADSIEEKMRMLPPKMPLIKQIPPPTPPPASLLMCSQSEPQNPETSPQLPAVLQNILNPSTTQLINSVVSHLRQTNAETEAAAAAAAAAQKTPLLSNPPLLRNPSPMLGNPPTLLGNSPSLLGNPPSLLGTPTSVMGNQPSMIGSQSSVIGNPPLLISPPDKFVSREDNFVSDYARDNFCNDDFTNLQMTDFSNRTIRNDRLHFEPPQRDDRMANQFPPKSPRYIPPLMGERFNENYPQNRQFSMPDRFQQSYNFNQNMDMQALDYYPPNAPLPANQYNCGPPLLSPEVPHFYNEQKPNNFGMMPNHEYFGHNEEMLWRMEDNRSHWERRDQDFRVNRDPRTYREYREMRESRDPRVARDNRDPRDNRDSRDPRVNRDPRENRESRDNRDNRDPRDNRDNRDRDLRDRDMRDPRLNKGRDARDKESDRDRSRFRDSQSQSRDYRQSRYESKFDRIYSRTNRERSRSRSRSRSYSTDTFASPLDSLYSGKEESKTGKGYGVQNFRIPKIKKEGEKDDESAKVTSTNEDLNEAEHEAEIVNDDMSVSDEDVDNNIESTEVDKIEENIDQTKTVEEVKEPEVDKTNVEDVDSSKSEKDNEHIKEVERKDSEPAKVDSQPNEVEAKPADQTILAQFFANLLGSRNKRDKKTALYSLISTFSDSFSEKELTKITKIIKANEDDEDSSEEEEEPKKPAHKPDEEKETAVEEPVVDTTVEELEKDNVVKAPRQKPRKRIRRISSGSPIKEDKSKDVEPAKSSDHQDVENKEESVVVTVGERIKSRKRASVTPPKPKKKCRTELDMLHEDIQDMFIRDGVLTASGKRMCRILKDDPSVLSGSPPKTPTPEEPQKTRKKPGPKSKSKQPNQAEVRVMKSVRVVIPKMADSSFAPREESPRRNLRRSARAVAYTESDDETLFHYDSLPREETSVANEDPPMQEGAARDDDGSDAETTDTEKDKLSQSGDANQKSKLGKRKRSKGWASGVIPSSKKKKKKQSSIDEPEETVADKEEEKGNGPVTTESDKSFVEPDKNYFIDAVTNRSTNCKLCEYSGRFITTHYKTVHTDSEVLSSRLSPSAAVEAIKDSEKNLAKYEAIMKIRGGAKFHFVCRFCEFTTNVPPTLFYDHITTHTGEYRHICPTCEYSASSGKTLKSHMSNVHQNPEQRVARKSFGHTIVFGFMCGECNYVQLTKKNVEDHINIFHLQKPPIIKINLSTHIDPEVEKADEETESASRALVSTSSEEEINRVKPSTPDKIEAEIVTEPKEILPPQRKKPRPKLGPKSAKKRMKEKKESKNKKKNRAALNATGSFTSSESFTSKESESEMIEELQNEELGLNKNEVLVEKPAPLTRRRLTREISGEEESPTPGRSRRAAKDKATEKLKTLMEATEISSRKKSFTVDEIRNPEEKPKDEEKAKTEGKAKIEEQAKNELVAQTTNGEQAKQQATSVKEEAKQPEKPDEDKNKENCGAKDEETKKSEKLEAQMQTEMKPVVKKEVELNVFTCKTDLQEENKKIEQERLQMMEELNKSVGSRTSLNFVDKLCNRLSKSNVVVKQEPRDDLTDSLFARSANNGSPLVMPILEKEKGLATPTRTAPPTTPAPPATPAPSPSTPVTPPPKKPVLEPESIKVSKSNFDVTQKNDKVIMDMIQKLKGKLASVVDNKVDSPIIIDDADYDSEGPPPLTHVNELVNVKPSDGSTKTLLVGGLVRVIKNSESLMFSCLVPPCVFSTENKEAFQMHCKNAHNQCNLKRTSTLCEMCGIEITRTTEGTLLENLFMHTITEHADFINNQGLPAVETPAEETPAEETPVVETPVEEPAAEKPTAEDTSTKPPNRILRLRKLSGDALSIIKKDWEEEIDEVRSSDADGENIAKVVTVNDDKEENDKENQSTINSTSVSEVAISESLSSEESPATMVELDMSEDNPFPFKIAGVMSLAEPQPPPLAPIAKPNLQLSPGAQLIVKEAKLSQAELNKPRKTLKAMAKFISSVSDLYKCPHYYCLFSTNFRDFLERHLKAHKVDHEVMIPCVYCDMKTPWEHVPMHIDIRHAHCRFACSYCLYRAVVKDYVFLHQDQMHPESDYSVIALPQPKHSKKFAIAEAKTDPKSLCEPYRCTNACNVEFLFENEFKRHLQDAHKSNFLPCGYKNCSTRVQANKMPNHWSITHGVSVYQCGYCRMSCNDITKMYHHFAQFHQGQQPNILIRMLTTLQEGVTMGYSPEAFAVLRKVITLPKPEKTGKLTPASSEPTMSLLVPSTTSYPKPPTYKAATTFTTKATLQVVTSLPQTVTKSVLIPSNPAINRTITFVSTSPSTSGTSNILFLPNPTTGSSIGSIMMAPQSPIVTTIAPLNKTVNVVPSVATTPTTIIPPPMSDVTITPVQEKDDTVVEQSSEHNDPESVMESTVTVEPVEHITVGEDNQSGVEDTDAGETDPLSLEADLNDAAKSVADGFSSDEESDENKVDKTKKTIKSGLLGYQLFRCAFCDFSFSNSNDLKKHATHSLTCRKDDCSGKPFVCVHCGRNLKNPHVLVEHIQCHGVLRFSCSLCGNKFPTAGQARSHAKGRHNITQTSLTPLHPNKANLDSDEYVVRPRLVLQPGQPKDAPLTESSTSTDSTENIYTPDQIDKIPMRHILSSSIKCALCSYSTKVRTNMVRHLQFHSEEKDVSDTAPVNPVPCLEKNEKMFDKMINLASSSHTGSRMGGTKVEQKEKEVENLPEFVATHCRYACPAQGCNYLCPEEANLRHHIIALHDSETSFICVHCKANLTQTDADSLIKHFKLHGLQLHKCQYCSFFHNLKHKVEKHVTDAHLDAPVKVITVRCLEAEPKDQEESTSGAPSTPAPPPTKVNKPWRCCMCKYKSGSQEGIQNHVLEKHEIDSQFKCALCTYKTNDKDSFTDHFKDVHDNQTMDIIYAYRKMEEDKEKDVAGGAFDTTPLWQRDRPRVRHIRGILFDESSPVVSKSPKKPVKASASPSPGPSSVKNLPSPGPSASKTNLDLSIESVVNGTAEILQRNTVERSTTPPVSEGFIETVTDFIKDSVKDIDADKDSDVIIIDDDDDNAKDKAKSKSWKRKGVEVAGVSKIPRIDDEVIDLDGSGSDTENDELSERNLRVQFGAFGTPLNRQLKCPTCNQFKSKRISDFIFHLFKEMKVYRFKCKICADESITYRYMHKHVQEHRRDEKINDNIIFLPANQKLEAWLQIVIREQSRVILQNFTPAQDPGIYRDKSSVVCLHCGRKYSTEQERNEHAIIHWAVKPYGCKKCKFNSYYSKDVEKHFEAAHQNTGKGGGGKKFILKAPTVAKELQMADNLHIRESENDNPPQTSSSSFQKSPVMEEDPLRITPADDTDVIAVGGDVADISSNAIEMQDPLGDVGSMPGEVTSACSEATPGVVDEVVTVPVDPTELITPEDDNLCDSDLVIVTKTDSNVPKETDVFCCEYCPFMTNSEMHVISHISGCHEHMHIKFKTLNRLTCEANVKDYVGCMICPEVGSEIRIRQHHLEKHDGQTFMVYRFNCTLCGKKFLKMTGMKMHFNKLHPGFALSYTTFDSRPMPALDTTNLKRYKCPLCSYERNFPPNSVNNVRSHVKQHFKAFACGICSIQKYKTRGEVLAHCSREHQGVPVNIIQDGQMNEEFSATMARIISDAQPVMETTEKSSKNTARKSTSAPFRYRRPDAEQEEYSFYGKQHEQVDLNKIMTTVEVNGMCLNMTAEKLSKIFDLDAHVSMEDCNLSVNLSSVFDS